MKKVFKYLGLSLVFIFLVGATAYYGMTNFDQITLKKDPGLTFANGETITNATDGTLAFSGGFSLANDQNLTFGTDQIWTINIDASVDSQLLIATTDTIASAVTDPLVEILFGTRSGSSASQQVFGIAQGTQASNTPLFTVDEDGDVLFAGNLAPDASDGGAIGSATLEISDAFFADAAVISYGDDQDVTVTHVADAALRINAAMMWEFRDADLSINSSVDGQLDIDADTELEIAATTVDLNGALDVSGLFTGSSVTRGTASFTTTDHQDTVVVKGATTGSIFVVAVADTAIVAGDELGYIAGTDTLFVGRVDGTTSGLTYSWWHVK